MLASIFSSKFIITGVLAGALLATAGCGGYRVNSGRYRYGYTTRSGSRYSHYDRDYRKHHRHDDDRYRDTHGRYRD